MSKIGTELETKYTKESKIMPAFLTCVGTFYLAWNVYHNAIGVVRRVVYGPGNYSFGIHFPPFGGVWFEGWQQLDKL